MDIADLKEILRILEAQDITEFELEQDGVKLRVCRASKNAPVVAAAPTGLMAVAPVAGGPAAAPSAAPLPTAAPAAGAPTFVEETPGARKGPPARS